MTVIGSLVCASSTVSFHRGVHRGELLRRTGFQLLQKRRFYHRGSVRVLIPPAMSA